MEPLHFVGGSHIKLLSHHAIHSYIRVNIAHVAAIRTNKKAGKFLAGLVRDILQNLSDFHNFLFLHGEVTIDVFDHFVCHLLDFHLSPLALILREMLRLFGLLQMFNCVTTYVPYRNFAFFAKLLRKFHEFPAPFFVEWWDRHTNVVGIFHRVQPEVRDLHSFLNCVNRTFVPRRNRESMQIGNGNVCNCCSGITEP